MASYGPPLDQFLRGIAEPTFARDWPDYLAMGFDTRHIPELIRMATDASLNNGDSESSEVYAPVHAWRTLGQLRAEEAIVPLVDLLTSLSLDDRDDWASEEIPEVLGLIGPAAIPVARSILENESDPRGVKINASRILKEVGQRHPGARDECVAILTDILDRDQTPDSDANGFIVDALIHLEAKESAGVIERAFARGVVDERIVGYWYDVWHDLHLEGTPPPEPEVRRPLLPGLSPELLEKLAMIGSLEESGPDTFYDLPEGHPIRPTWQPPEVRAPEDRKSRNKALARLEKKRKGKPGKKR